MISSRPRQAETILTNLPVGKYLVFAFLDANGNEFYDDGELAQVYSRNDAPAFVAVKSNRTASLELTLTSNANIPSF